MKFYHMLFKILQKIKGDKIFVYSSYASFYMLISAIPFITIFISTIKQLVSVSEYDISQILYPFLPSAVQNTVDNIVDEIFSKTPSSLISLSSLSLFWSASRGVSGLRRGIRFIYNVPPLTIFLDIISGIGFMLFFIILIMMITAFVVLFATTLSGAIMFLIGFIFLICLFSLIYFLFSERTFPFKIHIPGGIFASVSWMLFIRIFSLYIEYFSNYSYVYGSLTAILLLALWIYFSVIIFFLGAELNTMLYFDFFTT